MTEEFLKLHKEGLKDSEISRNLNITESRVNQIRWKLNLPPNGVVKITDEEFIEAFGRFKKVKDLVNVLGCSESAVRRRLKKLNLTADIRKNNTIAIEEIEEDFIAEYNKGTTQEKLAKMFDIGLTKAQQIFKKHNLVKRVIDKNEFTDRVAKGLTDIELSEYFGLSRTYVTTLRNSLNLERNLPKLKEYVELTDSEFQVMLGGLLGDSTLYRKYNRGDATGSFNHCIKQLKYAEYKQHLLKDITNPIRIVNKHDERLNVVDYQQAYCYIRSNPALNEMYYAFYKTGKKQVPKEYFEKIEALGLAIWFMDDGSNVKSGYVLSTCSFPLEDLEMIQDVLFKKFNIHSNIRKSKNLLYIKSCSVQTFNDLISPYIIPSMEYKLI